MKKIKYSAAGIFILTVVSFPLSANGKWKPVKNQNGIRVFTRSVQGSDFDEFKGIGIINARIDVILKVLEDVEAGPRWMYNCRVSTVLKKPDNPTRTRNSPIGRRLGSRLVKDSRGNRRWTIRFFARESYW